MYETRYRSLDPQIGRFWQMDPMADFSLEYSPYVYGNNNPVLFNDPLGLLSDSTHPDVLPEVVVTAKAKKLEGGDYNGVLYSKVGTEQITAVGYSSFTTKTHIPHDQLKSVFDQWVKELNSLSKLFGYASALAGGSVVDVKSLKEYKKIFKKLIKSGKIKVNHPVLLAIATVLGLRSEQLKDNAEQLVNVLIDYGLMHATDGTTGKGILLIENNATVGMMGESSYVVTQNFYDASSKKFIGRIYEIY